MGVRGREAGGQEKGLGEQGGKRLAGIMGHWDAGDLRSPLISSFLSHMETFQSIPPLVSAPWSITKAPII